MGKAKCTLDHLWGQLLAEALSPFLESRSNAKPDSPYTLPAENTTESEISKNFSQVYILMGKAPYSRNTEKQLFLKIKVCHVKYDKVQM